MKPPAFQFYPDDFIGGTCDMSAKEVGAFIRLLCFQWTKGKIPSDPKKIHRIAGCNVTPEVLEKFPDGVNKRLESERVKQECYRAKQSAKGQLSAMARANRGSTVVQPSSQPQANSSSPSPISNNTLTESATPPSVGQELVLDPELPPKKKTQFPPPPDPRRKEFLDIFREYYEHSTGEKWAGPDAADNAQLKRLFSRQPQLTPSDWREYLVYIYDESRKEYAPNLLQDCGTLALVCSKWDRIKIYSSRR